VKKRGCELAARMTYREAARVLSEELGTPLRAASVHRWVQEVGAVVQAQELAADDLAFSWVFAANYSLPAVDLAYVYCCGDPVPRALRKRTVL
jgi:hypothetical protein